MKKDIEIPVARNVYVGIVHEWNEEFLSKDWNAYLINDQDIALEMAIVVTKGYDGEVKTSTMRHGLGTIPAKSFMKIELLQEDVLRLHNEFFLTYFVGNTLFEKKFMFPKDTVSEQAIQELPVMGMSGVLAQ